MEASEGLQTDTLAEEGVHEDVLITEGAAGEETLHAEETLSQEGTPLLDETLLEEDAQSEQLSAYVYTSSEEDYLVREASEVEELEEVHEEWLDTSGSRPDLARPHVPKRRGVSTSYRDLSESQAAVANNKTVRRALQLQQDYEAKKTVAADAAATLQLEEDRLRQLRREGDTTRLGYQQVEVEKAWEQLTKLEKARDLAELAVHRQVASATEAERRHMRDAQCASVTASTRQQEEVMRAQRILRKEFADDKRMVKQQQEKQEEANRKEREAAKHQKPGKKRLAASQAINNAREQEANEIKEQRYKERAERYMQLKSSIHASSSTIQAKNERMNRKELQKQKDNERRKAELLAAGLNPYEVFRKEAMDEKKKEIEETHKRLKNLRGDELIETLLKDEKRIRKREKQEAIKRKEEEEYQRNLGGHTHYKKVVDYIKKVTVNHSEILDPTGTATRIDPSKVTVQKNAGFGLGRWDSSVPAEIDLVEKKVRRMKKRHGPGDSVKSPSAKGDNGPSVQEELDVEKGNESDGQAGEDDGAQGENQNEGEKEEEEPTEAAEQAPKKIWEPKLSKFEQDMMAKARIRHRENICEVQRCWAKEFVGRAFLSKPAIISFLDFEVGKRYKQVVEITNVSLTFNQFKLLPLDESIRDVFEIDYVPAGRMSAGITCSVTLHFCPKVLQDIDSVFPILAKTGHLEFPLKCVTKKTVLTLTPQDADGRPLIQFGHVLAGEKNTVVLSIKNQGALSAAYTLKPVEDKEDPFLEMVSIKRPKEISATETTKFSFTFSPGYALGAYSTVMLLEVDNGGGGDSNFKRTYEVMLHGSCVEVPIFVEKEEYDIKTLIAGHTYREAVKFRNRQAVAMKIHLEEPVVCSEISLNPVVAFCQGNGALPIQVKFTPKPDFLERNPQYLVEREENDPQQAQCFRIPLKLVGSNQVLPVWTALVGKIDTNAVGFTPREVNFGTCFVGSAVSARLSITNKCSLHQNYGFWRLPSCIRVDAIPDDVVLEGGEESADIACQDGGGTAQLGILLPYETVTVNVVYSPDSATKFEETLRLKVHTGAVAREFPIKVQGQGKVASLKFSRTQINMAAIPAQITTIRESLAVQNISNVPTQFDIVVPPRELAQLNVCPVCVTLQPKESTRVQFEFKPGAEYPLLLGDPPVDEEEKPAEDSAEGKPAEEEPTTAEPPAEEGTAEKEEEESAEPVRKKMLRAIRTHGGRRWEGPNGVVCALWKLPVFTRHLGEERSSSSFLSVGTSVVPPTLVCEPPMLHFGQVMVQQRKILHVTVRKLSERHGPQTVRTDPLPENACFTMLNAPRTVEYGKPFRIALAFRPLAAQVYKTVLRIRTERTRVDVVLKGICPVLAIDPASTCVSMGGVVSDATSSFVTQEVFLRNTSTDELSFELEAKASAPSFACEPESGIIPGKKRDTDEPTSVPIQITFRPDKPLERFREQIYVKVANQTTESFFHLFGHAFRYSMYLLPDTRYEPFDPTVEEETTAECVGGQRTAFSLTFDVDQPQEGSLVVGHCAPQGYQGPLTKATSGALGNFECVIPPELPMFTVEPTQGTVGPTEKARITFRFKGVEPTALEDMALSPREGEPGGHWLHCAAKVILSGGFTPDKEPATREFVVDLRAYVYKEIPQEECEQQEDT